MGQSIGNIVQTEHLEVLFRLISNLKFEHEAKILKNLGTPAVFVVKKILTFWHLAFLSNPMAISKTILSI